MARTRLGDARGRNAHAAQAEVLLEEGVGLMVREVVPDSLAARIGVKRNDVIVEVNGEAVTGTEVIARALAPEADASASLDLVVMRKGNRIVLHGAT